MVHHVSFTLSYLADAQIAQSVEQRIENPCVPGSIPGLSTIPLLRLFLSSFPFLLLLLLQTPLLSFAVVASMRLIVCAYT